MSFQKKSKKNIVLSIFLSLVLFNSFSVNAYAYDEDFYSRNNILFYNPNEAECSQTSDSDTASTAGAASGSNLQQTFIDNYYAIAQKFNIKYGIPWEAVIAQGILESGSGTSTFARERNNFFGIGAFDSNPDNAFTYATAEEGWEGYYKNIVATPTYRNHNAFNYAADPEGYIKAIKAAGYATDPEYVSKNVRIINIVRSYAQTKGYQSSKEIVEANPEALENAKTYAQGGSSDTSSPDSTDSADCTVSESQGSGSSFEAEKLQSMFFSETGGTYGAYRVSYNGCTTIPAWFIGEHTDLTYGHGNGREVVGNLVSANSGAGITASSEPNGIAIYTVAAGVATWGASGGQWGHTGLVVSIDKAAKKATVVETGTGYNGTPKKSVINTYSYPTSGVTFYNLTGHTKGI